MLLVALELVVHYVEVMGSSILSSKCTSTQMLFDFFLMFASLAHISVSMVRVLKLATRLSKLVELHHLLLIQSHSLKELRVWHLLLHRLLWWLLRWLKGNSWLLLQAHLLSFLLHWFRIRHFLLKGKLRHGLILDTVLLVVALLLPARDAVSVGVLLVVYLVELRLSDWLELSWEVVVAIFDGLSRGHVVAWLLPHHWVNDQRHLLVGLVLLLFLRELLWFGLLLLLHGNWWKVHKVFSCFVLLIVV